MRVVCALLELPRLLNVLDKKWETMVCVGGGIGGVTKTEGAGDGLGTVGSRARLPQFLLYSCGGETVAAAASQFPGSL